MSAVEAAVDATARGVVDVLCAYAEDVFACVDALGRTTQALLAAAGDRGDGILLQRDLAPLEATARGALEQVDGAVVGAGFVAAPGLLADTAYWLEWWTVDDDRHRAMRLTVETDAAADGFRDYTALPWFATPARTGRRHVTGPYVDYLCTDQYTLTFTAPVLRADAFAGVVGCDVHARTMERFLVPRLRTLDAAACVVNAQGRVVAGNRPDLVTGAIVRDVPAGRWDCPGLPLSLLVRD